MIRKLSFAAVLSLGIVAFARTDEPVVSSIESVGMTVRDMDRSVRFFNGVLGFEKLFDVELSGESYERLDGVFGLRKRMVRLKLGDELLDLTEYFTPRGRSIPETSRSNDRCFQHIAIIVRDMDEAYRQLRKHRIEYVSPSPQRLRDWNKNAGGIKAFYFKDPDGHPLEILQFPGGKGDSKWHQATKKLFLGIDHTAIVVKDTDASLRFYRDQLGLKVTGQSENYGPEQERLNNVFGARLRITALRAPSGPGLELLEYLAPRDGRAFPTDSKANDLWQWQIRLRAGDLSKITERWISPGVVKLPDNETGIRSGLSARDPDGHALLFNKVHVRRAPRHSKRMTGFSDIARVSDRALAVPYGGKSFTAAQIQDLLNNLHVIVFPLVNPDGRHYSQTVEALWRRNRNPANSGGNPSCIAVDINRNYDFLFDFPSTFSPSSNVSGYTSTNPCDAGQVYHGPAAFSEPESQNVKWLAFRTDRNDSILATPLILVRRRPVQSDVAGCVDVAAPHSAHLAGSHAGQLLDLDYRLKGWRQHSDDCIDLTDRDRFRRIGFAGSGAATRQPLDRQ